MLDDSKPDGTPDKLNNEETASSSPIAAGPPPSNILCGKDGTPIAPETWLYDETNEVWMTSLPSDGCPMLESNSQEDMPIVWEECKTGDAAGTLKDEMKIANLCSAEEPDAAKLACLGDVEVRSFLIVFCCCLF